MCGCLYSGVVQKKTRTRRSYRAISTGGVCARDRRVLVRVGGARLSASFRGGRRPRTRARVHAAAARCAARMAVRPRARLCVCVCVAERSGSRAGACWSIHSSGGWRGPSPPCCRRPTRRARLAAGGWATRLRPARIAGHSAPRVPGRRATASTAMRRPRGRSRVPSVISRIRIDNFIYSI